MSNRYDRLLSLTSFSKENLKTLQGKDVLIIGAGGVGQHIATYLVTNGVEHIAIVDFDNVEISNLNRQILLNEKDIGRPKVDIVKKALEERNSEAEITAINAKITGKNAEKIILSRYDIVVDALDNWEGKFVVSDTCHNKNIPFLHVGVDGTSGQFCIFKNKSLRDVLPQEVIKEKRDGVMGPVVGAIASMASTLLLNYLIGKEEADKIFSLDCYSNALTTFKL